MLLVVSWELRSSTLPPSSSQKSHEINLHVAHTTRKHSCRFYRHFHVATASKTRGLPHKRDGRAGAAANGARQVRGQGRGRRPHRTRARPRELPAPLAPSPPRRAAARPRGGVGGQRLRGAAPTGGGGSAHPQPPRIPRRGVQPQGEGGGRGGAGAPRPAVTSSPGRGARCTRSRCPPFIKANRSGPRPCPAAASRRERLAGPIHKREPSMRRGAPVPTHS